MPSHQDNQYAPLAAFGLPEFGQLPQIGQGAPNPTTGLVPNAQLSSNSLFPAPSPTADLATGGPNTVSQGGFFSKFAGALTGGKNLDGTETASAVGTGIQAVTGLASIYLGLKQFGLAKDSFKESKRQFNLNFDTQAKLTNSRLEDRQRARVASNPGAYVPVDTYLEKNRVGSTGQGDGQSPYLIGKGT